MMRHLVLFLSLITYVYSVHPDHSDRAVHSADTSGHHVRDHEEDDHQRLTDNGNVRTRNGDKHDDELTAQIEDSHVRGESWEGDDLSADLVDDEFDNDDEPRYGDDGHHEREHEEEDHELFQDKDHDEESLVYAQINTDRDLENNEEQNQITEEKPQLDYAGQGTSDERARGSFDRDESIDGRHDVYDSPNEDHVEDHETEGHGLVALINEDRDLENDHEQKKNEKNEEEVVDGEQVTDDDVGEEKPALEYAGQGTSDERVRGTFDRDEDQVGRRDTYSSPKEEFEEDHGQNEEEKTWDEIEREFEEEQEAEEEVETAVSDEETESEMINGDDTETEEEEEEEVDPEEEEEEEEEEDEVVGDETESEEIDDDETEILDSMDSPNSDPVDPEEPPSAVDTVDTEDILKSHINEDRDMESVHEPKGDEMTNGDDVEDEEKPELEYAGQGTGDERARGTFDRDESIEGRHDVFESPQEIHEEPDHDGLHDDDEEEEEDTVDIDEEEETEDLDDVEEEETVDEEETENLEVVEEETEEEAVDEEEEESDNLEVDDMENDDDIVDEEDVSESELVVVHDATKMERLSNHWMMSLILLVVTGAALVVLLLHLLQRCREQKLTKSYDPESTPLIADKV